MVDWDCVEERLWKRLACGKDSSLPKDHIVQHANLHDVLGSHA